MNSDSEAMNRENYVFHERQDARKVKSMKRKMR